MKKTISASILLLFATLLLAGVTQAKDLVNVSGASGVAINGYDPVAFFTEKKPVNGDPSISAKHEGATYFFSSKENRDAFASSPSKYAPQCGGFCAYGASVGALFPIDITTWQIKDEKLYFNLNPAILELFNKDLDGNIAKANKNWPELEEKNAK
jgi:YHS domain-containing protein